MKNNKAFSLIELIIIIGIMSVLGGLATISFNQWIRKANIEKYTKEIFADIQDMRTKATFTKRVHEIEINTTNIVFRRYSTLNDTNGIVLTTKQVPYTLEKSSWSNPTALRIRFETNGIMTEQIAKTICIPNTAGSPYDTVIVTPGLTLLGVKINSGGTCEEANVRTK